VRGWRQEGPETFPHFPARARAPASSTQKVNARKMECALIRPVRRAGEKN